MRNYLFDEFLDALRLRVWETVEIYIQMAQGNAFGEACVDFTYQVKKEELTGNLVTFE